MISVVIPTLNAEKGLPLCLSALVPGVVHGLIRDVVIADGGSDDGTITIASQSGATIIKSPSGRGVQLAAGAEAARGSWLLFLHADTVLETGWDDAARSFIEKIETGRRRPCAAAFQFALGDDGMAPRLLETMVWLRASLLRVPYGDQGLLISRTLFDEVGGYRLMALMEDLDIVRRLGRKRITVLRSRAITNAERYRKQGYFARVLRNQICLAMYSLGVPAEKIARFYRGKHSSR